MEVHPCDDDWVTAVSDRNRLRERGYCEIPREDAGSVSGVVAVG